MYLFKNTLTASLFKSKCLFISEEIKDVAVTPSIFDINAKGIEAKECLFLNSFSTTFDKTIYKFIVADDIIYKSIS